MLRTLIGRAMEVLRILKTRYGERDSQKTEANDGITLATMS